MDFVRIHQALVRSYEFEDVMEVEKEWYDKFMSENPNATPADVWSAGYDEGYEYDTERSEANYDDEIIDTWIGA